MRYVLKSILFCLVFTGLLVFFSFAKGFLPKNFERLTTSAFGAKNTSASIWTVKQPDDAIVKHGGIDWITILPSLALLLFALICIEWYMRRKSLSTLPAPIPGTP